MEVYSENNMQETRRRGRIEVICGSMFSGKTEELIRRLKRAKFAKQKVEIFKPALSFSYYLKIKVCPLNCNGSGGSYYCTSFGINNDNRSYCKGSRSKYLCRTDRCRRLIIAYSDFVTDV